MRNISATRLQTYFTCPKQYEFKYVYKLLQLPNEAFVIGKLYHKCVEDFHSGRNKQDIIASLREKTMKGKVTDEKINTFGLLRKMFECYAQNSILDDTIETEYNFNIEVPNISVPLYGFIDRITENGIIEYKTSSFDYKQEDIIRIQTDVYSYVFWKKYGKMPEVIYSIMNKKKVNKSSYRPQVLKITRTETDMENLEKKCLEFCGNVESKKFKPSRGKHCLWCPFGKNGTGNCK